MVIGNGIVGYRFCEKLVAKSNPSTFNITVFGEEVRPAYDRVHLSEYFAGKSAESHHHTTYLPFNGQAA